MSFEKISKKKFNFCVLISALPHSKLYSVRKFPTVPDTFRVLSRFFEISRYSGRPVKQPHGFPSAGITLRLENQ